MKNQLLIEKYLDNELTESELAEVSRLTSEDSNFRSQLNEALEFKGLATCSSHSQYGNLADGVIAGLADQSALADNVLQSLQTDKKIYRMPIWLRSVAAALLILLPIFYFVSGQSGADLNSLEIAQVKSTRGQSFVVRGDKKINIVPGDKLFSGDQCYVQDKSQMTLAYKDGSHLTFLPSSFVRLSIVEDRKRVELFSGQLTADVNKQLPGKEMLITTEHSSCEVLGTAFTLSSSDISSLLDVERGKVRFNHRDKSLTVDANHYAVAGGQERFAVQKSGKPLFKSPLITKETPGYQTPIKVDIKNAKKIYLVISNGGDDNRFDHGAWIAPRLVGPEGELDLTKHKWQIAKSGFFRIKRNRGFHGGKLTVNGILQKKGIAAHATSLISWDIPPGYESFEATGAILDSGINREGSVSSIHFEVYTDMPEKKLKQLLIRRQHY